MNSRIKSGDIKARGPKSRSRIDRKRQQDPDPTPGRAFYLRATQVHWPEFWYSLLDATGDAAKLAAWTKQNHNLDKWMFECVLKTLELWKQSHDLPDLIRRYRARRIDLAGRDEIAAIAQLDSASIVDFATKWYVFDLPCVGDFVFEHPAPPLQRVTGHDGLVRDEWFSIKHYRIKVERDFKAALRSYTRKFEVAAYADWNDRLLRYAKWTALYQAGNSTTEIARWDILKGARDSSNVSHCIKYFARHIGLSSLF